MVVLKKEIKEEVKEGGVAHSLLVAFDYGLRRIGVAVGNTLTGGATPLKVIAWKTKVERHLAIDRLVLEWKPDAFVVGLPIDVDGKEHEMTKVCRHFAEWLILQYGKAVYLVDERYSSQVLESAGLRDVDAQAAAVILQQYFDGVREPCLIPK